MDLEASDDLTRVISTTEEGILNQMVSKSWVIRLATESGRPLLLSVDHMIVAGGELKVDGSLSRSNYLNRGLGSSVEYLVCVCVCACACARYHHDMGSYYQAQLTSVMVLVAKERYLTTYLDI